MDEKLKGFITNLGKYNEGYLIGEWIDFPIDEEELEEVYKRIGINEEYEEFFFTDWDDPFGFNLGEYVNIDEVNELAEQLEEVDQEKLKAIVESQTSNIKEAIEMALNDDVIFYENETLEDVAYQIMDDCYDINNKDDIFSRYFDYEAFARDLSFDGFVECSNGVLEVR